LSKLVDIGFSAISDVPHKNFVTLVVKIESDLTSVYFLTILLTANNSDFLDVLMISQFNGNPVIEKI
jgi:hypothetical protein